MFPIGPDVCGVGGVGKCPGCVTNFSNTKPSPRRVDDAHPRSGSFGPGG